MAPQFRQQFSSEADMLAFAAHFAKTISPGAVIFLYGPLGVGKTTFTRGFLQGLGFQGKVKSPSYTIIEPYDIAGRQVFHFDFYRIKQADELRHLGLQEYFIPSAICLIEWPENGLSLLPPPNVTCYIEFADSGRQIVVTTP